jgi:hypothetical protein
LARHAQESFAKLYDSNSSTVPVKTFLATFLVALAFEIFVGLAYAQLPPGSIMTTGTATSHSVSRRLRDMRTCPTPTPTATATPTTAANSGVIDPVALSSRNRKSGNFLSDPIVSFEGLHADQLRYDDCFVSGVTASDDSGAAGLDRYVQVVNTAIAVYDKAGNVLAGPISTTTFWEDQPDCGGTQLWTDSVVRYDRYANRWVMCRPGVGPQGQNLCLAVSQTSDPLGKYDQYAFAVNNIANGLFGFFNDYPKIAVFSDAYYATADPNRIFTGIGNTISAFDRTAMLTGSTMPQFVTFFIPAPRSPPWQITHSHMLAADLDGRRLPPSHTPEYVLQVQDPNFGFPAGRLQVYEFHVDWNSPSSATLIPTASLVPEPFNSEVCASGNCIKQPGVTDKLDSLSYGYMMQRLIYRNFGTYQTLLVNHTVAADGDPSHDHAGIRWYELRKPAGGQTHGPWEIYQQGTYAPDANDRWLGSIAMDVNGNIALGFGVSGHSVYPSLHYAGRRPTDPLGTFPSGDVSLIDGADVQRQHVEFGDYSQMTIDPTDDCTFWYTGTYYPMIRTPNDWHTRIGSFRFSDCAPRD